MKKYSWILFVVFWIVAIEGLTRWMVSAIGDPLQAAALVLQPDSDLGWKQRPLLKTRFQGQSLVTNEEGFRTQQKPQSPSHIWVLGPSSSFGWGVGQGETYSDFLETQLHEPVLNAGEIGFSIIQGHRLFEKLLAESRPLPKFLILAYGINDLDHFRFFGHNGPTDSEFFLRPSTGDSWLASSAIGGLILRLQRELVPYFECGIPNLPQNRVPLDEFSEELKRWIAEARALSLEPILINTAFHPSEATQEESSDLSNQLYRKSLTAGHEGHCALAVQFLKEARSHETSRIRSEVKSLNLKIADLAQSENIHLLDLQSVLAPDLAHQNFVDPVHFSKLGNEQIAKALAPLLH